MCGRRLRAVSGAVDSDDLCCSGQILKLHAETIGDRVTRNQTPAFCVMVASPRSSGACALRSAIHRDYLESARMLNMISR